MGLFSGIGKAELSLGGKYFDQGSYKVRVERVFVMKSRKRADLFIVECAILESNAATCPVGIRASQVIVLSQDAAMGNVKAFIAAANGIDPGDEEALHEVDDQQWEPLVDAAVAADNPLCGTELALEAVMVKTKAGTDFTKHYWTPLA